MSKKIYDEESDLIQIPLIREEETNITLLEVLKEAATNNGNYNFTGKEYAGIGFYIQCIGGLCENINESIFWMIYEMTENGPQSLQNGLYFFSI